MHEGGCVCGAVRYRVTNAPFRAGVYFKKSDFELTRGALKSYEHKSDESGRWLRMEFCPDCGTTVTWTLELFPDGRGVAGGTFDDPSWIKLERHTWTRSKQHWVPIPPQVERHEKSAIPAPR